MQKYKSNITSTTGAAIRNVPVTVLTEAGELADLFLDRAGTVVAPNPLATDSSGNFYFYASNGRYSLRTTVEGVTITDDDAVLLQDPEEITVAGPIAEAVAAAKAAAKQAQDAVEASGIPELVAAAQNAVVDAGQALQEARSASQASDSAKQAAESAQAAAEVAQRDAKAASTASGEASERSATAAQAAAQSAASIDPASIYLAISKKVDAQADAGLMTNTERQKLGGVAVAATKNASDEALRNRASHTGSQAIETIDGLNDALSSRIRQTAATGAALLPEGDDAQRPAAGSIPAGVLVMRGNGQDAEDYKLEFWDRVSAGWKAFADRTWVGKQIATAVQAVKDWVDQQIGFTIIYPNGGSAAAPAGVAVNSRYVIANPFPGRHVMCEAQILIDGVWGATGWYAAVADGSVYSSGTAAHQVNDTIIVQTGGASVVAHRQWSGGAISTSIVAVPSAKCRVRVWAAKGVM